MKSVTKDFLKRKKKRVLQNKWQKDFQIRKDAIEWANRKQALEATNAKLKAMMSEDARTEEELDKIKSLLGIS